MTAPDQLPPFEPGRPPESPDLPGAAVPEPRPSGWRGRPGGPSGLATWGPWLAITGTIFALVLGLMLTVPIVAVNGSDTDRYSPGATSLMQLMTGLGFLLAPLLIASTTAIAQGASGSLRFALGRLGLVSFRIGDAFKWIAIAIFGYLAFAMVWSAAFGEPVQDDIAERFGPMGVQILLIALLAPIAEEVCFRGLLFGGLRSRMPFLVAAALTGLLFGLLHASTGWSTVPQLAVLGMFFCLIYEKTGSLWPAIALHFLNNLLALTVLT